MHMSVKVYFLLLCTSAKSLKSNIVIFLADDLGIGDIGIYGNTTLKTPNIDRIGREGVKLEHHVSAASMCSPSRAALLTGRYPVRTGVASTRFRAIMNLACTAGLPPDEITFAEQAKKAGYHTAVMGKWHLGVFDIWRSYVHHPLNQGFDEFYGLPFTNLPDYADTQPRTTSWRDFLPQIVFQYLCVAVPLLWYYTTRYKANIWFKVCFTLVTLLYACHYINLYNRCAFHGILMRGYDVVEQPVRIKGLTSRLVRESLDFLERRYLDNNPFLLYIPWHIPKTAVVPTRTFEGKTPHGQYGDCVEEMDWGVGEVLGALDRLGFTENTLVYFASDHGGHLEEAVDFNGGYNGIFRGGKGWGGVEGSIRVPGLIRWPGQIPTNQVVHEPTSLIDIFPTLSKIMGTPLPTDKHLDGRDILPLLRKDVTVSPHEYIMHYCGTELHAVTYRPRTGNTV